MPNEIRWRLEFSLEPPRLVGILLVLGGAAIGMMLSNGADLFDKASATCACAFLGYIPSTIKVKGEVESIPVLQPLDNYLSIQQRSLNATLRGFLGKPPPK